MKKWKRGRRVVKPAKVDPYEVKLGKWIAKQTANYVVKIGRVVYIHPERRFYVLEFTGECGEYREAFAMIGD